VINAVRALRDRHNTRLGRKEEIEARLTRLKADRESVKIAQELDKETILLMEYAGQAARELVTKRFNAVVSFALQSVFGEDYTFDTELTVKRNAVSAEFRVMDSKYSEPANPLDSRGGGVVDVISLALRVVMLELFSPRIDGPLVLDEPTRHLSDEYSGRAAELLNAISTRTGRQIVLVTHDDILAKEAEHRVEL